MSMHGLGVDLEGATGAVTACRYSQDHEHPPQAIPTALREANSRVVHLVIPAQVA
jgi:hypothetical protein